MVRHTSLRDCWASRSDTVHRLRTRLIKKLSSAAPSHRAPPSVADSAASKSEQHQGAGSHVRFAGLAEDEVGTHQSAREPLHTASPKSSLASSTSRTSDRKHISNGSVPERKGEVGTRSVKQSRSGNAISRQSLVTDLAATAVAAGAAGVSGLVGLMHLPWLALVGLSAAVGVIAFAVTQAVVPRKPADIAARWWFISTLLLLLVVSGSFVYHKLLDPGTHSRQTYQFVVNGNQTNVIQLFGEAGGPPQSLATGASDKNGLIGGQSYNFDCWVTGSDGKSWLRYERFGQSWWAPRRYLHPPSGETEPLVPHC